MDVRKSGYVRESGLLGKEWTIHLSVLSSAKDTKVRLQFMMFKGRNGHFSQGNEKVI